MRIKLKVTSASSCQLVFACRLIYSFLWLLYSFLKESSVNVQFCSILFPLPLKYQLSTKDGLKKCGTLSTPEDRVSQLLINSTYSFKKYTTKSVSTSEEALQPFIDPRLLDDCWMFCGFCKLTTAPLACSKMRAMSRVHSARSAELVPDVNEEEQRPRTLVNQVSPCQGGPAPCTAHHLMNI